MKSKKIFSVLLCAALVGVTASVGTHIHTSKITSSYGALELSDSITKELTMNAQDIITFNVPEDFKSEDAVFANTDEEVVQVSELKNGSFEVTALAKGKAIVTLTDGVYNYSLDFTVAQPLDTKINVSEGSINLTIKDKSKLPTVTRSITNFAALKDVTVKSSSERIATVEMNDKGILTITGQAEGKVNMTVSAFGCNSVSFDVTVYEDIEKDDKIKLSDDGPYKIYLKDKKTKTIYIENYEKLADVVEGEVDDTDVATVSMSNNAFTIRGNEVGRTNLTLSCEGADDKVVRIYVYDESEDKDDDDDDDDDSDSTSTKITKITIDDGDISLNVGKSRTLDVTLKPSRVSDKYLRYKSEDTDIATVSSSGKVTGKSKGTTYIKAYYSKDDDIYDRIKVKVTESSSSDNSSSTSSGSSTISNTSTTANKEVNNLPYCLPVGTYDVSKLLNVDASRLKSKTMEIVLGANNTNIVLDGTLYNVSVQGVNFASGVLNYTDVPGTHWSYLAVVESSNNGYLHGVSGSTFGPSVKLTYGDTFTALSKLLAKKGSIKMVTGRSTVDKYMANHSASKAAYLPQKNIMSKLPESEVKRYTEPGDMIYDAGISRIHMANILWVLTRDMGLTQTKAIHTFKDVQSTEMLNYVGNTGLMRGDTAGNFNPNAQLTRAELATILFRLDKLIK